MPRHWLLEGAVRSPPLQLQQLLHIKALDEELGVHEDQAHQAAGWGKEEKARVAAVATLGGST